MRAQAVELSSEQGAWAALSRRFSPYVDLAIGLAAAGVSVASLLSVDMVSIDPRLEPADPLSVAATAAAGLSLSWRRSRPATSFAVFGACCLVVSLTGHYIGLLSILLLLSLYSLAAYGRRRDGVTGLAVVLLVFAGLALLDVPDLGTADLVQACALLLAAWAVGDAIRSRRAQQTERLQVAEQAAATAREQAARAIVEERLRIARELHDVVAHSMSLIAVQAGVGAHVIGSDVRAAERALEIIADTSRTALNQTRSMLGLLREPDADPTAPPVQTIDDLDALVADFDRAGVSVALSITGRPRPLDPRVELAAYRVVQESLTNVLKHSGSTKAQVEVTFAEEFLDLCVQDQGPGPRQRPPGAVVGGHGLVGLRERARLLGGTLEYGPSSAGFRVQAHLPAPSVAP